MTRQSELLSIIHEGKDPYAGFPHQEWKGKWVAWGSSHPWFHESIERVSPKTIIEVGTFTGSSAIHMADKLMDMHLDSSVICVDTFLGGIDHWLRARELLGSHFGRPSIYYEFISNVITRGHAGRIVPLALDSTNAARLLVAKGVTCQMLYIDGSHERDDVAKDLAAYWPLLDNGGIMLIDDMTGHFLGVIEAAEDFSKKHNLTIETNIEKGRIVKP